MKQKHCQPQRKAPAERKPLDLASVRARLANLEGREYWRGLEELAETEQFREFLQNEFPRQAGLLGETPTQLDRRAMLRLMAASLALAGLSGCTRQPEERIVPYVRPPEEIVPGKPLYFATAMPHAGSAIGLLVESHMGRPTKVEGNPQHPASMGATDVFAQASILTLYDPDRSQVVTHVGRISSWTAFLAAVRPELNAQRANRGAGLRILTETVISPTLAHQLRQVVAEFPAAKWHQYDPTARDAARAGAIQAFGRPVATQYRFDRADVILSLDADFLANGPGHLRYAREFAARRVPPAAAGAPAMNRLYVVETTPSNTGAMSDHRLPMRAREIEAFAREIAAALETPGGVSPSKEGSGETKGPHAKWIAAVAKDLQAHRGRSLVLAGDYQPAAVHALAHAMNQRLGNVGSTIIYTEPIEANSVDHTESLNELVRDLQSGAVQLLFILGANPAYTAPGDLNFAAQLAKVKLRVHMGLYQDETAALCHWHLPEASYLEAWSDARSFDGTTSIIQPLIAPLYQQKSAHELLAAILNQPERSGYDIVREYWRTQRGGARSQAARAQLPQPQPPAPSGQTNVRAAPVDQAFEDLWQTALHDGIVPDSALPALPLSAASPPPASQQPAPKGLEVLFRPDPSLWDGRFANNGWLQELPRPLTKLTWDNVAMVSPATAQSFGITSEDVVELHLVGRPMRAPVWVMPGQADDSITVHLGYGRTRAGRVGNAVGFNAYSFQRAAAPWFGDGLGIVKTGQRYPLAATQLHHSLEGRHIVREATLAEYQKEPDFARHVEHAPSRELTLYPEHKYEGYAWGMTIDLNRCIGCNACTIACQAENNIPVVGKTEVIRGREMQWIRIDRYYSGGLENPEVRFQPMLCVHCENAPCEVVCPVNATVHSREGLNEMVYNRCVGTRYCSNNCPYKVRRFNFFLYSDFTTPSLKLMRNPDVTVRSRGVMEKCTYCVQRINAARIEAKKDDRRIRDGEVVTACQAVCPAEAIVFGDINDRGSRVAKLKADPRDYGVLAELNTRPRTSYLAAVRNPNPELEEPHRREERRGSAEH